MIALRLMGTGEAMPLPAPSLRPLHPEGAWLFKQSGATESTPAPSRARGFSTSHGEASGGKMGTEKPQDVGCCFWSPIRRLSPRGRLEAKAADSLFPQHM